MKFLVTGSQLVQNADGTLTTSTYDAANQLLTATTKDEVTTFTSDANGNRILENASGSLTTYTWDEENRMIGADDGANTDSFIYAGNGQRRKKSTSTQDINYLWDEQNILEELDDSNNLIAQYTGFPGYWGGLSSLDQPGSSPAPATAGMGAFNAVQFNQALFNQGSEQVETESHYYLFDLQLSNRLLLDAAAATDNEYLYQTFGEKVLSSETIRNPFQFQGQAGPYFDADKRTQMGARIVDPTVGKWLSPDPIGFAGGDWNLYRFVRNNPANMIDPSGLSCFCCKFYFAFAWCCDDSCSPSGPIFLPKRNSYPGFGTWNSPSPGGGGASQQWPFCSQSFAGGDQADIPFFLFDNSSWQNLWQDIEKGWYPTADALNPFGDPYKDMGYWSDKDINSQWSFGLGTVAQQALLTADFSPQAIAGASRAASAYLIRIGFAEKVFVSPTFGVASKLFGNSATERQGVLNVSRRLIKVGWSGTPEGGGGYLFRIGLGARAGANQAARHIDFWWTFVENDIANPIINTIRASGP